CGFLSAAVRPEWAGIRLLSPTFAIRSNLFICFPYVYNLSYKSARFNTAQKVQQMPAVAVRVLKEARFLL
ncbi:MAG: hypothetical protein K6F67_03730, partial [Oscillospiraceae bacterium]|nr:hypothetical protein [Oscillospiraceae bacterium]